MTYDGGPYITLAGGNIKSKSEAPYCIMPFNMPYKRMTQNLDLICKAAFDASYLPWEWWIDHDDGEIHFDERKGIDRSEGNGVVPEIVFVAVNVGDPCDIHLGETSRSSDAKKTVQRIRVTGKSEGRRQDEVTSNWQEDDPAMETIGTFYEEIISEKTLSGRITANEWAKVWVELKKNPIEEVEVEIERDPYAAGSWDIGDDVTIYDPKSRIARAAYRIRSGRWRVDEQGEHIYLSVTNAWEDITDKIADIYQRIKQLQLTGFTSEEWTAGGSKQGAVQAQRMENLWSITREYESANELQEVEDDAGQSDPNNSSSYVTNPVGPFPDGNGIYIEVKKDALDFWGPAFNVGIIFTHLYTQVRFTNWVKNPRFHVRMMISQAWVQSTSDTSILFGISDSIMNNFLMFRIHLPANTANAYRVDCWLEGGATAIQRDGIAWIGNEEMHDFEAHVDWDDGYVFFYLDKKPCAVIPIPQQTVSTNNMCLMHIAGWLEGDGVGQGRNAFYTWKTQAKAEEQPM